MFIHEAACKVLAELGSPAHVRQIYDLIVSKGYYSFGAKNPCNALSIELSRKSINVDMGTRCLPEVCTCEVELSMCSHWIWLGRSRVSHQALARVQ
jgi:hypothetical protein